MPLERHTRTFLGCHTSGPSSPLCPSLCSRQLSGLVNSGLRRPAVCHTVGFSVVFPFHTTPALPFLPYGLGKGLFLITTCRGNTSPTYKGTNSELEVLLDKVAVGCIPDFSEVLDPPPLFQTTRNPPPPCTPPGLPRGPIFKAPCAQRQDGGHGLAPRSGPKHGEDAPLPLPPQSNLWRGRNSGGVPTRARRRVPAAAHVGWACTTGPMFRPLGQTSPHPSAGC